MNIQKLIETSQKPDLYSKGTAVMWVDEHISTQLLKIHINPETDLASRKESTISLTVDWILDRVTGDRLDILDLGCGPGLYAEKLAISLSFGDLPLQSQESILESTYNYRQFRENGYIPVLDAHFFTA